MHFFQRSNKASGYYWLTEPIENLKIKIRIKLRDGLLSLPNFDDYANISNLQDMENVKIEEHDFKWQDKRFSAWEIQRYSDPFNCLSEVEKSYHALIETSEYEPNKIFTYVNEDFYMPLPTDELTVQNSDNILSSCLLNLSLNESKGMNSGKSSNSIAYLFKSTENINDEEFRWSAMHIMYDNSEYNEDKQLLLKQEAVLISLFYNIDQKCLIVRPDVNDLELNPYSVELISGLKCGYQYEVQLDFGDNNKSDELQLLLERLLHRWQHYYKPLLNFTTPDLGKKLVIIAFTIQVAKCFDMDHLYVEFDIKVPDGIRTTSALHGRTHTAERIRLEEGDQEWCFGQIVDLELELDADSDPQPLQLVFEVISVDFWNRHRTEGYTHLSLDLSPGRFARQLSCSRPEELDHIEANNRRFFVGGCHLLKDLDAITKPQPQDANFRFVNTGKLRVVWDTISQSCTNSIPKASSSTFPEISESRVPQSAASVLLKAEAALEQYSKASQTLAAAAREIETEEL